MKQPPTALLVFFNGKSNAGGAERMALYLDAFLSARGLATKLIDERFLLRTPGGMLLTQLFKYRHFKKRKAIYMARLASAYLWTRRKKNQLVISNGEATPFYLVDFVICHGNYHTMEKAYGKQSDTLSRIAKLQRHGLQLARRVIAVTAAVKADLITLYGIDAAKIFVVTNRVDSTYFQPLPKPKSPHKTLLYVGRLEDGKGLGVVQKLAGMIERRTDWKLLIACNNAGNTDWFAGLKNTEIKIGLHLETINAEAYAKADLVIFPSLYESFGMVTVEALAAGIPVIGTPVGIIPDLAARSFPGVSVLPPFDDEKIFAVFDTIVQQFQSVDRKALHEKINEEFGMASYWERLDEVMGASLQSVSHA